MPSLLVYKDKTQLLKSFLPNLYSTPGIFDEETASLVLQQLIYDSYRDDGTVPAGYKFKVSSCMKCMFFMHFSPWLALRSNICQVI